MLNKNFANPKSKAPIRKLTPEEWYKQQMAAGFLPAAAMDEAKVQELLKAGEYPSFYDPRKTTKDEKGGLLNKDGSTENVFIDYQYKAPKAPVIESKPVITPTGAGIEVGPYQTVDKNTGKTYHTGTDIEVKPQIYMGGKLVEEGKKKGGLVKKYETGGSVRVNGKDQTDSVVNQATDLATTAVNKTSGLGGMNPNATSAIAGGLGQVAMMGGAALDASNEVDQFGQINENKAAGATALKWGGSAAGIAANPALLAATGGLSLLAIPAAAGVGAIVGARKAGKENDLASQRIKEEQDAIKKQQSQSRVEEALRQRELGLAKGGKVVGAGTGTSDSIKAKVEEGSFIVPAKNAKLAEDIREKVLRTPPKRKATLMEEGGEVVKLSNGEHKFTPEEAMKIEIELGPEIFKTLAPESEVNELADGTVGEMAGGGKVSIAKAKEILKDGTAHGKPLTDKQKGYFGWLAGGGMKCGGMVKKYADGGEVGNDPYMTAFIELSRKANSNKATQADLDLLNTVGKELVKASRGQVSEAAKKYIATKQGGATTSKSAPMRTTKSVDKTAALTDKILAENTMDSELADLSKYEEPVFPTVNPDITGTGLAGKAVASGAPTPSAVTAQGGNANAVANEVSGTGNKLSATDLQGLIGYGVPLAQAAIGWNQLQKQGKRPVDKLDPDFLSRIDAAKARALTAEKEAMYGMTPEEKFLLNQQSQGLANQQRATARNQFASGSGGTALGLERMAINDAYGRGLMTKVQDKNLQLQKQAIAADRAATVDQLVGAKAEMNRRLFNDTMNAWQQNQQSGAQLLGTGLANMVGEARFQKELQAAERAAAAGNSWMNNIGR